MTVDDLYGEATAAVEATKRAMATVAVLGEFTPFQRALMDSVLDYELARLLQGQGDEALDDWLRVVALNAGAIEDLTP